jgi:hypothetical protein
MCVAMASTPLPLSWLIRGRAALRLTLTRHGKAAVTSAQKDFCGDIHC